MILSCYATEGGMHHKDIRVPRKVLTGKAFVRLRVLVSL